ncbi:unnamed protein product [Soboliphyme baturini]|uniref:TPR_REGION domain-containing protein n=1 Tax=Soboliphyme baturini TaxID=241478 RepID=A0A183IJ06_9BILA|nr:unnamed protein product [Soboliphyme baturini]
MYAAEASSKMAEFQEAMAYLEQGRCTENATEFDECVKALPNWYPNSSKVANAAVIYNQCLMYSMQQKTDEACMKLSQLSPNEGRLPVQVMLLGICLQIQQGKGVLCSYYSKMLTLGRTDKVKALLERLTPEIGMKPQQLPQVPPPQ